MTTHRHSKVVDKLLSPMALVVSLCIGDHWRFSICEDKPIESKMDSFFLYPLHMRSFQALSLLTFKLHTRANLLVKKKSNFYIFILISKYSSNHIHTVVPDFLPPIEFVIACYNQLNSILGVKNIKVTIVY